jgi:hypothetical protein
MRESVQGWRLKWFYAKDSLSPESQLPRFVDVLEAKPKNSWKNILSPDEKVAADELFAKFLRIKEADGQTMVGTEVAAVFLKRRVQPVMARVRPMWLYSGPKDETRINAAELSEKELLDEVRRLTFFSQEDLIPLTSSYTPFDADHPPPEVTSLLKFLLCCYLLSRHNCCCSHLSFLRQTLVASGDLHNSPDNISKGRGSSEPVDFHTVEHTSPKNDHNDPIDSETVHTNLPPSADDTCDTEGSVRDDDADHDAFVNAAAEETRAPPTKRSIGGFADEDDLLDM